MARLDEADAQLRRLSGPHAHGHGPRAADQERNHPADSLMR